MNHTTELIEVHRALKELVELKELKDSFELNLCYPDKKQDIIDEYDRRKPLAWATAKRVIKKFEHDSKYWGAIV